MQQFKCHDCGKIAEVENVLADVEAAEDLDELKEAGKDLVDVWKGMKHKLQEHIHQYEVMRLGEIVQRAEHLEIKLDRVLEKIEEMDASVEGLDDKVDEFSTHISEAKENFEDAKELIEEAKDLTGEDKQEVLDEAKGLISEAKDHLKEAQQIV